MEYIKCIHCGKDLEILASYCPNCARLAAEVERLKLENKDLHYSLDHPKGDSRLGKLQTEVEKLRDALRLAADEPNIDQARAIADKALGGEQG